MPWRSTGAARRRPQVRRLDAAEDLLDLRAMKRAPSVLLLASVVAVGASAGVAPRAARAEGPAAAPAARAPPAPTTPKERLTGVFLHAGGDREIAARDEAIDKATESMFFAIKGMARSKLRERLPVPKSIRRVLRTARSPSRRRARSSRRAQPGDRPPRRRRAAVEAHAAADRGKLARRRRARRSRTSLHASADGKDHGAAHGGEPEAPRRCYTLTYRRRWRAVPTRERLPFLAVARRRSSPARRDLGVHLGAQPAVRQLEAADALCDAPRAWRSPGRRPPRRATPAPPSSRRSSPARVTSRPGQITGRPVQRPDGRRRARARICSRGSPSSTRGSTSTYAMTPSSTPSSDGFDAGVRLVEAIDRDMVHVRLTSACRFVVAGSPAYFARAGVPQRPEDLLRHACIGDRFRPGDEPWAWELERGKRTYRVPVRGPVTTNDGALLRSLARKGVGLIYTLEPLVAGDLARRPRAGARGPRARGAGLLPVLPEPRAGLPAFRAFVETARARRASSAVGAAARSTFRTTRPYLVGFESTARSRSKDPGECPCRPSTPTAPAPRAPSPRSPSNAGARPRDVVVAIEFCGIRH